MVVAAVIFFLASVIYYVEGQYSYLAVFIPLSILFALLARIL